MNPLESFTIEEIREALQTLKIRHVDIQTRINSKSNKLYTIKTIYSVISKKRSSKGFLIENTIFEMIKHELAIQKKVKQYRRKLLKKLLKGEQS